MVNKFLNLLVVDFSPFLTASSPLAFHFACCWLPNYVVDFMLLIFLMLIVLIFPWLLVSGVVPRGSGANSRGKNPKMICAQTKAAIKLETIKILDLDPSWWQSSKFEQEKARVEPEPKHSWSTPKTAQDNQRKSRGKQCRRCRLNQHHNQYQNQLQFQAEPEPNLKLPPEPLWEPKTA